MAETASPPAPPRVTLSARFQHDLMQLGGATLLHALQEALASWTSATSSNAFAAADALESAEASWRQAEDAADAAYERSWEKLHCGAWKSVAGVWREAFAAAAVLQALCLQRKGELQACMKILDVCLMMAGPYALRVTHELIAEVELALRAKAAAASPTRRSSDAEGVDSCDERLAKKPKVSPDALVEELESSLRFSVPRRHVPSLAEFRELVLLQNEPVIITGAMEHWPALGRTDPSRAWRDVEYFRRVAGWRTVPIEIGSSYLEDDWRQELMTMNEFLDQYILPREVSAASESSDTQVGYLAQHHLFEQIPVLGRDIVTPDYCVLRRSDGEAADDEDEEEDITVNAWFGPRGTVSPLHFDPKDNLLCQVVGAKYLRLYAPQESGKLYPVDGMLANTSQVQVDNPDYVAFPAFRDAAYVECVLKEGEMLYIPPRYWHFVKSLSVSFSVSFWWS